MISEPHLPRVGDLIDRGKYRIDAVIGEGGMGVVFAATHIGLDRRRAIKWLLPKLARDEHAVRRFLAEARIAAKIEHTNVVAPIDISEDTGAPYIVMELLEGETLGQYLGDGSLPLEKAGRIFLPILHGVAAAHAQHIVHRDLKPANIFLARWGGSGRIPKVLDFGIAKVMDQQTQGTLTDHGALLGTIQYMSPEQLKDASSVGPASDVYSLGVILYRMLSGKLPYEGNIMDLALRIREGKPTPLSDHIRDLPPGFEAAVMRALAPQLSVRYTDVRGFAIALIKYFPEQGLDFGPMLRPSEPSPVSDLPPRANPAHRTPSAAKVKAADPPRARPSDPPTGELSTFHPVATAAPSAPRVRPWQLFALLTVAVVGVAVVVRVTRPDQRSHQTPPENVLQPGPAAAAPAPKPIQQAPKAIPSGVATHAPERPPTAEVPAETSGWQDLGGMVKAVQPVAPDAGTAAAALHVEASRTSNHSADHTAPDPKGNREKSNSSRSGAASKQGSGVGSTSQRQPAAAGAPANPLDTILEQNSRRLDTILDTSPR